MKKSRANAIYLAKNYLIIVTPGCVNKKFDWLVQLLAAVLGQAEWKVEGTALTGYEASRLGKQEYHIKALCFRKVHVLRPTL